ncbi:hypothetical protein K435DRAFT_855655 [Dendrothele bispora CBS 962.96]|uniref:Uncharacterized protein n=1 Tax=Dendrothele bispora (strain CBS 962.96) TaxID=1314807 RepID=A0A4S8MAL7_DENBC|nr:hypothetical protein K435DRAFT_855655 [Dendrothele bispora CBS 962.96]
MSIPDGEYYIFDKFNDCVTANGVANGAPVLTHFAQTDDQQWQLISGEGVAQIIQNIRFKTYIGSSDKDPILSTSPLPWYINETTDTDWYQISRNSNQGGPFWVGNGQSSAQKNASLSLSSGGWYSFFFLPVSNVNKDSQSITILSSLVETTPSSSNPAPVPTSSATSGGSSISSPSIPSSSATNSSPPTSGLPASNQDSGNDITSTASSSLKEASTSTLGFTPITTTPSGTIPVSAAPSASNLNLGSSNARSRPIGAIVGGAIGGFVLMVLMIFFVWLLRRRLRARSKQLPQGTPSLTAFTLQSPTAYSTVSEKAGTLSTQSPPPYDEVGK